MTQSLAIRPMTRPEAVGHIALTIAEGWNPGLHDTEAFLACDPDAFIAAELDGKVIGGGAITAYGDSFGFMGLFIMHPELRRQGLGSQLWRARRDRLLARLNPGATIGMDGVFAMADWYARGGFVLSHRNLRFCMDVPADRVCEPFAEIVPATDIPFEALAAYDRSCFPAPRDAFLKAWITLPDRKAVALVRDGQLAGYGVVRRCREGCKIGPLFADDADGAEVLFAALAPFAAGGSLFMDVPEPHTDAMAMVVRHGMSEVFGCARMYLGAIPDIAHERVYGVTTFELG
ncbi:GNAT family N-acetyltransferase [Maricaulis maris]|uniref:GNAT family N-acetyltransferase n=1 Tax=Maricaulis maris TaxID=74318 RepID=UPI003B8D26B1